MLDSARRGVPVLARWLLDLGIVTTLAANVVHGLGHSLIGAAVAAWPAVALVGSYELLMVIIRGAQVPSEVPGTAGVPRALDAVGNRPAFGLNFDPSHFVWQDLDPVAFLGEFRDRIYHVDCKEARKRLDGRNGRLGSHLPWATRGAAGTSCRPGAATCRGRTCSAC